MLEVFKGNYRNINFITADELLHDIQREGKNEIIRGNAIYSPEKEIDDTIRNMIRYHYTSSIFKYDIDRDGELEIVMEKIAGSARIPYMLILKYDAARNCFFVLFHREGSYLTPFLYEGNLFFCEEFFDYTAGRFERINLVEIDSRFTYRLIQPYRVEYTYNLAAQAESYITNGEINAIFHKDYHFLRNYIRSNDYSKRFFLVFHEYNIDINIVFAPEPYVDIDVFIESRLIQRFYYVKGFTLREIRGKKYIILLDRVDGLTPPIIIQLKVFELSTLEKIYENIFEPVISLVPLK
ncbi:MAG: hypothetical protein LBI06_08450 [Treponema sp.]|nr:hypothetical protein [Treponema sp.]